MNIHLVYEQKDVNMPCCHTHQLLV